MAKLGIIADVHCNLPRLDRALAVLADCDVVVCAGDLMYQYRFAPEVLDLLDQSGALAIVGNHDLSLLASARSGTLPRHRAMERLAALPRRLTLTLGGSRVLVCHGSPWDAPEEDAFFSLLPGDTAALRRVAAVEADVVVVGHTHVPIARQVGDVLLVNPGSCGEPGREGRAFTCASVDLPSGLVAHHVLADA